MLPVFIEKVETMDAYVCRASHSLLPLPLLKKTKGRFALHLKQSISYQPAFATNSIKTLNHTLFRNGTQYQTQNDLLYKEQRISSLYNIMKFS